MTVHRATHLLHSTLSIASSLALSHDISRPLKSFLTVSVQFFRGLPLLFLPSGNQCNIWLALLSFSVRHTCPSHRSLLFLMMFSISSCQVLSLKLLFETVKHLENLKLSFQV